MCLVDWNKKLSGHRICIGFVSVFSFFPKRMHLIMDSTYLIVTKLFKISEISCFSFGRDVCLGCVHFT